MSWEASITGSFWPCHEWNELIKYLVDQGYITADDAMAILNSKGRDPQGIDGSCFMWIDTKNVLHITGNWMNLGREIGVFAFKYYRSHCAKDTGFDLWITSTDGGHTATNIFSVGSDVMIRQMKPDYCPAELAVVMGIEFLKEKD